MIIPANNLNTLLFRRTTCEGNIASCEVSHFSKFAVVSRLLQTTKVLDLVSCLLAKIENIRIIDIKYYTVCLCDYSE